MENCARRSARLMMTCPATIRVSGTGGAQLGKERKVETLGESVFPAGQAHSALRVRAILIVSQYMWTNKLMLESHPRGFNSVSDLLQDSSILNSAELL